MKTGKPVNRPARRFPVTRTALLLSLLVLGACAQRQDARWLAPVGQRRVSPKLLLNVYADQRVDPQLFAYRSAWPAVKGDTMLQDTTFHHRFWYDRQSLTPGHLDHSYRYFRSHRVGTQFR